MNCRFILPAVLACLLCGQAPPQPPPQPETDIPVIKMTTRLLQVNVVVHDKKGDPVSDLTQEDFVLYDKGQEQKIRFFQKESDEPLAGELTAVAEGVVSNRVIAVKVDGKTKVQPLPNSLTVILLDGLNTRFLDQRGAKEAVAKFLHQLHPGDRVAIYTLTNNLTVLHDFTSDVPSLLAALDRHRGQESEAVAASSYADSHIGGPEAPDLDAAIDRANALVANYSQGRRAAITMQALRAIANHLAGLPGRKNLIWLSGGFPSVLAAMDGSALKEQSGSLAGERRGTWRVFNDVGLAIYPVDARGLIGGAGWNPSQNAATPSSLVMGEWPMDARSQRDITDSFLTMNMLADRTGGRAFLNNNDIAGSIHRAMDDARVTYVLYYAPAHDEWDGKFREIKIKLNRPGLEARYRKGYYALPDLPTDQKSRQAEVASAATSPLPATGLTMAARLTQKPTESAPHAVLSVVLDGHEISFGRDAQGQQDATVDVLTLAFGDQAAPLASSKRTVHLALKQEAYDLMMRGGIRLTLNADAPGKSQRVRVVARDAASGRVGSVDVPLK
jgi:VWFA-related protein